MERLRQDDRNRGLLVWVTLLLILILCFDCLEAKANKNEQFDPDGNETTVYCTITPYQNSSDHFRPRQGQCHQSNSSTLSDAALQALAVAYAPVLFFHPLEKYSLSSVDSTFADPNGGKIYDKSHNNEVIDDQLNLTTLLRTSRDPVWGLNSYNFYFERPLWREAYASPPEARYGDGYDEDGRSKAKIYYNAFESGNGTWTFNYYLYYLYNGQGNMGIVSTFDGQNKYTRFQLNPYGVHEGDWEAVSVMVCPPATTVDVFNDNLAEPLAVHYRQHSWSQITDCTKGECVFYKSSYHPVGFVALNSHATYPISAQELIYSKVNLGFFFNLQAFLIVDRTTYKKEDGSYHSFFPGTNNVERLQNPSDLTLDATDLEPYFWQGFGGFWGNSLEEKMDPEPPLCLADDQLGYVDCPDQNEDQVFDWVMQLFGVANATGDVLEFAQSVTNILVEEFAAAGNAPTGPVAKNYYQRWTQPITSPFWNLQENFSWTGADYCASIMDFPNITTEAVDQEKVGVKHEFMSLIIVVAIFACLNFLVPLAFLFCRCGYYAPPINFSDDGIPIHPHRYWHGYLRYSMGAIVYTCFFIIMLVSGIVFVRSSESLLYNLENFVPDIPWDLARSAINILGLIICICNLFLVFFLWLQVFEMRGMINNTYTQLSSTDSNLEQEKASRYVPWSPAVVDFMVRFCFALLFVSLMTAMIFAFLGIAAVGFAAAFVEFCNAALGSLDGFCVDLNILGIPQVLCGHDFQSFCNEWAKQDVTRILWSSFFVFVSHFYAIAATGYAAQQRRSIPSILQLYHCDELAPLSVRSRKDIDSSPGEEDTETCPVSPTKSMEADNVVQPELAKLEASLPSPGPLLPQN